MHNKGRQQAGPPSEFKLPYFFGSNPTSWQCLPSCPALDLWSQVPNAGPLGTTNSSPIPAPPGSSITKAASCPSSFSSL